MISYIKLMRPAQYIKNFLLFLPLIFSGNLFEWTNFYTAIIGFICFSFVSSFVYIINDIHDRKSDQLHETKKHRPIASGKISVQAAVLFSVLILILALMMALFLPNLTMVMIILLSYILINLLYNMGLKKIPLLDVGIIVIGFLLRLTLGSTIIGVETSNWLYLTVMAAAFYMVFGKRKNELDTKGTQLRKVLESYDPVFLLQARYLFLGMTIVFYSLWCADPISVEKSNNLLIWTIPVLILILLRFDLHIQKEKKEDPVEIILMDPIIVFMLILYSGLLLGVIYI